jgi:hypothetical protein
MKRESTNFREMDMKNADKITQSKAADTASQAASTLDKTHAMIATAAYYRAECRGFAEGCDQEDWLAAEAEIEQRLRQG